MSNMKFNGSFRNDLGVCQSIFGRRMCQFGLENTLMRIGGVVGGIDMLPLIFNEFRNGKWFLGVFLHKHGLL